MIQSDIFDSANMNIKKIANSISIFLIKRLIEIFGLLVFFLGILLFVALNEWGANTLRLFFSVNQVGN